MDTIKELEEFIKKTEDECARSIRKAKVDFVVKNNPINREGDIVYIEKSNEHILVDKVTVGNEMPPIVRYSGFVLKKNFDIRKDKYRAIRPHTDVSALLRKNEHGVYEEQELDWGQL